MHHYMLVTVGQLGNDDRLHEPLPLTKLFVVYPNQLKDEEQVQIKLHQYPQ